MRAYRKNFLSRPGLAIRARMAIGVLGWFCPLLTVCAQQEPQSRAIPSFPLCTETVFSAVTEQHSERTTPEALPHMTEQLRAEYAIWQALPEQDRTKMRQAAAAIAALPLAQRQRLCARFAEIDSMERRGWRLGPRIGAYYVKLHPLIGFVPASEQQALQKMLFSMDERELANLVILVRRTAHREHDGLRQQLLALSPEARAQWLEHQRTR